MALRGGIRFSADDIWDTPEDGKVYEVIDGDLFVSPPPFVPHQRAIATLSGYMWQYVHPARLGEVFTAPIGLVLDDQNGLQPDLVYVARERAGIVTDRAIEGAPDLVVEVHSPRTRSRDRGLKMRRYAAAGIPHYWMLDPRPRTLEAYRLGEQGYELTGTYGPGSVFHPNLFPGLDIPIDDLWT